MLVLLLPVRAGLTTPIPFNGIINNFSLIIFEIATHGCLLRTYSNWFSVSPKCEFTLLVTGLNKEKMIFFIVLIMPNKLTVATYLLVLLLSPFIASYLRSFA